VVRWETMRTMKPVVEERPTREKLKLTTDLTAQ
jgi:hypothetical protein